MRMFRSLLYAPGNQRGTIEEVAASGADAIILDLEDKVPMDRKAEARSNIREYIERLKKDVVIYVRVNSLDSGMLREDLEAVAIDGLEGIRIPKVDSPETVKAVDAVVSEVERAHGLPPGGIQFCLGLESARAIYQAYELCSASGRVSSLAAGLGKGGDLQTDMAYLWTEQGTETLYIRSKVVLAARAAGIPIPLDGGYGTSRAYDPAREEAALIQSAKLGRQLGYRAKICFHASQVEHINRIFVPTQKEIDYSRRVMDAYEAATARGSATASVDGVLIDDMQAANARSILSWAKNTAQS